MNLSEVLNVALPDLPARRIGKSYPRVHPNLLAREHMEGGVPAMVAMVPRGSCILHFTLEQWALVQMFDGERSYRQVAELYEQQTGVAVGEEQVREFAEGLDEAGFWYETPLEMNVTASQKLAEQRQRRVKKKVDLASVVLSGWDPDVYITKLHQAVSFIYTKWFTFLTLAMFAIMALVFVDGWHEIWRDTLEYYTFTHKGASDLAEFWLLFFVLGFFHESAHGLTCKHFGGEVHKMGFMLVYLSPAFFADISEVFIYGAKWTRVAAIIAGIWIELMFCSVASIVWWGTPAGSPVHDFAYKIMLITGVAVVLMNLNPLIKLDGYYLFTELISIPTLKENSTEYVSSWVKRKVFRVPVEVPYLARRRRSLFVIYAVLSGAYSYVVLFAIVSLAYNIGGRFSPEWAFVPASLLAFLILRARLRSSWRFMRDFYLDKKPSLRAWWNAPRKAAAGALVVLGLFAPVWRETVAGRFVLQPQNRAVIRAAVPGQITEVLAEEGAVVVADAPVFRLRNLTLETDADKAQADLRTAEADTREAQLNYTDLGRARGERASQSERYRSVSQQVAALQLTSPISGIVVTPRIRNLVGSFVQEGTELAEIDNIQTLQARIFIPEFQIHRVVLGAAASLKFESLFQPIRGRVSSIAPASSTMPPGLLHGEKYKGIAPPSFYVATVLVSNSDGIGRPGMSGDAKISVARRSVAWFFLEIVREFIQRKVW